jgi:hypothetical protein
MQIIRKIVKREEIKAVFVPKEYGDEVEILILPLMRDAIPEVSKQLMRLQEQSGFSRTVLADSDEDVWNDL